MERWCGRVALVTGASAGIGAAVCRRLATEGMMVVGVARNIHNIQVMARELEGQSGSLTAIKCDVTKDDQVFNLFSQIKQRFGGVDVCINNAGMSHGHTLLDGRPEEWREMLDVNVVALSLCSREAVACMRRRGVGDGHIIHISSISGHRVSSTPPLHFYSATKHAVAALTEGLRQELQSAGSTIRVTAVSPGLVSTEFTGRMLKDEGKAREALRKVPTLKPEDVVESLVHILAAPPHVQIHDIVMRPTGQEL